MYDIGCTDGQHDHDNNWSGRETVLDFGEQSSAGGGSYIFDANDTWISNSHIESMVESFAEGYWECTADDTYATMFLEIGTSNYGNAGTTTGKAWGGVVNAAWNWAKSSNVSSQVIIQGASDLELGWDTYTNTDAWVNGYESVTTQLYLDYGDAQGCPYGEYDNASCSGKGTWTQNRVRWIAYGQSNAISAPEIYFPGNAGSWAGISWYSKTYHGVELTYIAPWDEYDLDSGTDTPTQAWDDLWNYSNNLGVATTPPYSMKIHYE